MLCEESPPPDPKYKVGDRVKVDTYRGDPEEVNIVEEPKIHREYYRYFLDGLEDNEEGRSTYQKIVKSFPTNHYWAYRISEFVKIGKDDDAYSNVISEEAIHGIPVSGKEEPNAVL